MIKKLTLLFALSIFVCGATEKLTAGASSKKVVDLLIKSADQYQSSEYAINEHEISKTIATFHKLTCEKIKPPKSKDFEQLQRKT
ncbi:MAG: hypothetical protein ACE5HI_16515, partial [bacterium]